MKKEEIIKQLEDAKNLTSVVSIDSVIILLNKLEKETITKLTSELIDEISDEIETCLDRNCRDLVDRDSAEFELDYSNTISLVDVDVDVREIMSHVTAILSGYVDDECGPSESEVMQSVNEGLGL